MKPASTISQGSSPGRPVAHQELRHALHGLLGGGDADAHGLLTGHSAASRSSDKRQVRAALGVGHRVQLVDDHGAHGREHLAARDRREQDEQGLGRGDEDVRRRPPHARPLHLGRVAGAHRRADLHVLEHREPLPDAGQGLVQVLPDVVRQRLQRRHVEHPGLVGQPAPGGALLHQRVDGGEERRERLARAGGRGQQGVPAGLDGGPGPGLDGGRRAETVAEPAGDGGVEIGRGHGPTIPCEGAL